MVAFLKIRNGSYHKNQLKYAHIAYDCIYSWPSIHNIPCKCSLAYQSYNSFEFSVAANLILNGGYQKNHVIGPDILYDLLHSWPSIHKMSSKYSHADQSYSNFEFLVAAIFIFLMEAIAKSGDMSTHLVWFGIQLTINTQILMQMFTCITKL